MSTVFSLSQEQICAIIKTCARARVERFTIGSDGNLDITFRDSATEIAGAKLTTQSNPDQPELTQPQLEFSGPDLTPSQPKFTEEDLNMLLMVEDAAAWEASQLKDDENAQA